MHRLEESRRLVEDLLRSQPFAVLSTDAETGPYASLIAFWVPDDLSQIVFATMQATHKYCGRNPCADGLHRLAGQVLT